MLRSALVGLLLQAWLVLGDPGEPRSRWKGQSDARHGDVADEPFGAHGLHRESTNLNFLFMFSESTPWSALVDSGTSVEKQEPGQPSMFTENAVATQAADVSTEVGQLRRLQSVDYPNSTAHCYLCYLT